MEDNDNRRRLYDNLYKEFQLPEYNQFSEDMKDETKRKRLWENVGKEYQLPDFDKFSKDMGYEVQTTQQGNQNAKKPQQTAQSSHVEEGRGLSSDNGYSKQKTAFDKAAEQAWNKLAHKGGIKWTIEGHPEVKMVAVTDDLVKKFPQLEQSRGYQVPFNMSTGTPIMQNIDDKGNIITPDEASEQYTKILTNQDFDYVPKQETAAVQIGSVVNTALSTKGGWLDRMARKSMAQYGDDWEHQKFESDGKEVSSSDVFGKVKQTIYDYYNSVLKGIRTHLMFNSDEEKQAYVDNLYKTGQLKEEDIPKANVLHYVQNVDKEEQIEAVRQATLNRQLELEMAQERFNQLPQREKGESDFDYNGRILHEGALYEQDIRKLKKQIAQLDAVSDELQGNNTSWKEWGHAFNTSGIGSIHAWDLGATDLKDAIELNKVANGMKRGMQMTSSDYMALRVMSQANEADAIENAVMPVSYKSKKGGFISAPFSFGFFVGGDIAEGLTSAVNKVAGKVISKAVKGAVLKAEGKKALSAATNLAEKAAESKILKFCGMLGKDFEKAFVMENTTGAATTGAEILNRHIGTVTESDDGFKMEGESLPTAIIKGEISQNIESQTEFLGEHFPSSLKFIRGMAHTKVGSAMGLRNLAAWLTKVSRTEFATTLKSYATKAGINGVLGEYLEEVAGTAENALLVGDQKFSDLFDVKQQEEVAGSVVLSCLGMGIFGTAIYTGQRGLNMPTYYRLQHLQNKWDNAGLDLFTGEEWAKLKDRIDNTPNEGMKFVMADILRGQNMTEEQMRAAYNYASCTLTLRGMNIGAMKAAQLGLTDDRHIEQDNAYVEGRQAKDEDKHDIQIEFEDRSHELAEKLGISEQQLDNMSDEELESLTGKDDQLDNLIYDYQTSHAKYQGVVDNADDEIDKAAQEAARQTDMATDKSRGTVRNAIIKAAKGEEDYGVYIVSGNVATNEDGSINVSESDDMILYYDPKSGKIEHCDAMRLASLGEEVNAEETRNQAIADAKEKAIRKQAGIIDGTVGEGTSFTITDAEGNEHTYEVLADNGDGSAMITMDGNVQDTPVSLQDLQNLKDAEEAKRLEAAKMQRQQYEEEREKQNAPVEDNLDYADIINTNGNVEIAEVVDEEGNAMFPDAEEVFFVQNQGNRAKVMVLDSEGNLQPKLVKKSSVRTLGTMSVDEYRQGRQQALKEAENASEPSLVDETETSNNVVPTGNITTDNTTTNETQLGNEAEVTTSNETQNISNEQENTPKITLEDGTEVPMLEDGNPDFSQLTAGQVAELYDSQFGEDAGQIITNNVNRSKKALDKANAMTVSGGSFVEQKASKEAKDKAIAEAKEKYDSAKAIEDAYNERMLAKEEDTPEGRQNLIEKARRKFNRMKGSVKDNAQAIAQLYDETVGALLHRLYDSTGIDVFDDTANTVDEYVASSIAPYSLNYEGTETSKGVKQETGLSRSDFAKTGLLAKEGKGKTIGQLANDLWRDRPANLENITDQDVRNAIIDLITSGQTAFGLKNHIQNLRIAEAESVLEQQKRQADELAHAEKQKEEESQSTEMVDNNAKESSNTEATPADAQEEDKLADMPFEAPSPDEDAPFSAKDKAKDPLEVWNNMTDEEKAAYIEKNRVKDTRLVDDVVGKKLRKAIEKIAEMMGATIQWQRTDMIRNGWFNPNTKTIYLALDSSILEGVQFVFGHEMTHEIKSKSPVMYDELKGLVKEKYGEELFEAITKRNEKRYAGVGKTDEDRSYYEEETVADAIGKMINDLNLTHSIALKMSHPLLAKMHDVLLKIKNAFKETPYKEKTNGIIRTIEQVYVKTANGTFESSASEGTNDDENVLYSLRQKPEPEKKGTGYKVFVLGKDGKLYPPMVANPNGAATPVGVWLDADAAPVAGESKTGRPQVKQGGKGTQGGSGKLAYRPGWHLGVIPYAIQFNRKDAEGNKTLFPKNFVFAEVEYAADKDYQDEAHAEGINNNGKYQHSLAGLKHLPTDGYYMYRTNPNPETDPWVITGAMKVNRLLTRAEQADIVRKAGREPQQIQEGDIVTDDVVNSINQEIAAAPKFSLKVYHGSGADFTEFDFDHMGEGAGTQAFGWGGYVTSSKKIGKSYATLMDNDPSKAYYRIQRSNGTRFAKKYPTLESFLHGDKQIAMNDKFTEQEKIDYYNEMKKLAEPYHNLYEVDIPDDNGSNYLEWEKKPSNEVATKIIEGIYGLDDKTLDDMAARDIVFRTLMYDYIKNADKKQMIPILVKTNGLTRNTVYDNGNVEDDMRFVYNRLSNWMGSPKAASKFLSSLGFTGIKYPAGTIYGGAKEGDVNYVIFKPEDMQIVEHEKFSVKSDVDNQGNPLNQDGTLKLEKIKSVDELTDEDFLHPTRNVELPSLPKKIADAIGTEGKPVVIKKNIFERNYMRHKDVTPELSKKIFKSALYNPDLYGQNQKKTRPYNWVLINTKDEKGNNRTVLLEVNPNKDNVEIVHWHFIDERGLKKIRKQVDREDGQLLILPSDKEEVGALSDPTVNLSAANIANPSETSKQNAEKFSLRLQDAINETDTDPTEAQKKSGNYKKGHVKFGGYDYTIENPKGSYRSGVDENGKEWKQKMNDTYGYIRGKFGKDGDHLDMFINDKADLDSWNGDVFVVDQVNQDGTFDEHKVMYGYGSLDEAKKAYLSNYEKGWTGLGNITPVSKADFDKWLDKSNRKLKPFADYADITSKTNMDTAPSSFEEFLEHPAVRYSIRNEKERAAAEDAYNFAQENRPDRYSRYAIVNMEKPGAVPQYLEKKAVADNWRRYYNKLKWGNYKLFDLDKPFEDNVKNLVGKFPETFRKKNDTTLSKINELTADYNKRKEEYDAMSNSIQELLNGLMKQGRSLAEAESVIRDWGLYKEMDSKYQNLMGIRKQLNELRSGKVADGERYFRNEKERAAAVVPDNLGEDVRKGIENAGLPMYDYDPTKEGDRSRAFNEAINSSDNIRFSLKEEKEKIVADAKANGTYMTAPNGEKTKLNAEQWVTVRTTNFKNWFGDWENDPENASKVVDENGEPMVVWHGRSAEFNTVEKKEGVRFIMGLEDKVKAEGFFFSPNKGLAEEFASNSSRHRGGKANVIPCFLNIRKPMDLTREDYDRIYEDVTGWDYIVGMDTQDNLWGIMDEEGMADKIKEKGYDGAIFVEEVDDSYEPTKISYCALDANQIKSAENNNGDFSADNNDIRFSLKSMMEKPEGWKQANKKAIHIAEAIERDPKFSVKNLDGTLIKAGTYFSGGGLVEEGLKGIIDPVVAVEYDEKISGVYRNNFGNHIVTADVRDVDPKELVGKIDGEVEYFHASPVCKNYSLAKNNHEELELDKETAASTAEFISKVRPKVVTIENVKGYKDSEAMKTITDALDEAGYKWDADVYNAADYGGYTNRERLIVRAVRDGELPAKPEKQKRKSGWYEAVEDIMPTLTEKKNGVAPWMDERLKADGIDWRHIDKPLYVMGSGYANGTVPHAFADELLPTLRTKSGDVIVMPDGKVYRAMGRVLARVSGVSDDYQMPASEALSHTIIGNGIPTQLTENVIAPLVRDVLHPEVEEKASLKDADRKQTQLDIILKTNPMLDDYHTGIRKVEDIKTLGESVEEARSEAEKYGYDEWSAYPDITNDMLQNALETGEITIYSSKPIKNGVFVTPSYMQASDYAGGGNVYEKTVPLTDVAWINTDEGQYAKVDGERYSLKEVNDKFNDRLAQLIENPNQKDRVLHLGRSSQFLIDGGIADAEIELDFDKFVRKSSEKYKNNHPFSAGDIKDLPKAIAHPVAVFNSTTKKDHVVMTELNHDGKNFIVAIRATEQNRKNKVVLEVNQITSLYPKGERGIIYWINNNKLSNVDKEKALHFIEALQPHAGTLTSEELSSAANIVRNFVNPKQNDGNLQKTEKYSLRVDRYRDELNQWKKDNNLPKDAERPQLPVREPNESAADFLKRVKEYRRQAALWATAPTYEDHLLVSDTAQGQFNLEMQRKAVLTRIVIQDSMLAIRKAQEAIMKEVGVDKLNFAEDAYTAENRSHGKAKNEFEEYNDEFLQPLRKAYNELMQRLGKSYDNVKVYMIAKHGLERNAYIAFKYALDEDYETNEERMNAYNNYKADMDRLNNDADFEAGRIDFAAWKQRDGFIRTKYAPSYFKFRFDENGMTKDYSGLSALFDADDYEGAAADLVKEVEDANPYYTDELWYATNDATKKILRDSYNAGMMTEDNFNFVSGMYRNYIPLRGWGDTNADQVWNYVGGGKGAFNQVVKEAKGRKSLADDPIAYIENMAESAILMNNRNWVKQHLLLLAQNHRTSLLNVSKAWYIKTKDAQGNEEWIPASPQITEGMTGKQVEAALEAFEQKMEQMQQNGEATQKREHLEISYPQTNSEEREHEVRVMNGGEEYVIYVNGDPQLAQAVNNTRARKVREGLESSISAKVIARTGRYMAAAYTSMSPLFIPSNYMRDLTMTLASTAIREDARYNYLLRRNMLRHWNTFPMVLSYQNGTLREKVRNGSASRVEQMFYDFMMNGGETGFVTSVDVEDLKKKFRNDLKDLNRMAANPKKVGHIIMNSIETLNRAIEDSNRFMVYMTSIEYGRSIEEAVNNAKDVTLNFNRKGTGEHWMQNIRNLYLFINPAIQSLQTLGALAKHHRFKFTTVTTGWLASGLLAPMLNNLLMSFFGGDDDKDKYWQFTKWDRRNNFIMWIPFTKEFVKIPLAQEFRGFYGVGDMIASKLWGGEKAEESWRDYAVDLAGQIVDMLPLDPTGYDGNVLIALMPNVFRPIFELGDNVDFTGKPIFRNSEYNKYDPNFTKAYVGTPDWLVRISKMVNSIDNKYPDVQQNAIDRFGDPRFNLNNPAVVDHVLSSYLGGAYTMGSQILGVATKALNGDDIKMADIPLASKFVSNPDDRPVSKKQGEEFWDMKERHDRAANTLSKLKKKAKVDGDYSTLDIFFGSDEYRQYKEDDKKVKKYEEDRKKEKAQETGEAYRPHKTTADDVYKSHTTPKDDFEDMKMKQLYEKLNSYKIRYEAIDGISGERGEAYYKANKAAIDAIEEIAYDKSQIASIKKGFLSDGQNTYDADGMKDIRELRKRILDVLEKANKVMLNNRK